MKRTILCLAVIFFLGCLALGALAVRERSKVRRVDQAWRVVEQEEQKRVVALQHEIAKDKAVEAAAFKEIARLKAPAGSPNGAGARKVIHMSDVLKDHPEYRAFYAKQMRRNVDRMFGDGLSTLNLTPDQLSKLEGLLTEGQMGNLSAQQAAEAAGLKRGTPEWQAAMKKASENLRQQVTAILGPNADSILAGLQMRARLQNVVQLNYAPDFAAAGIPLSPAQSAGLVDALAEANGAPKDAPARPANYTEPDPNTGLSPRDDEMIADAARVLTPEQIVLLRNNQIANGRFSSTMKQYTSGGPVSFAP